MKILKLKHQCREMNKIKQLLLVTSLGLPPYHRKAVPKARKDLCQGIDHSHEGLGQEDAQGPEGVLDHVVQGQGGVLDLDIDLDREAFDLDPEVDQDHALGVIEGAALIFSTKL